MTQERRATYRVSVRPGAGLAASVHVSETQWQARPGNISAEGMFLRLEPDAAVDLEVGSSVHVEIASAEETFVLHGIVRSRRAGGYGVFFPEKSADGYLNPLDRLGQVCARLQRELLARRR